jgi:hypothetical protein
MRPLTNADASRGRQRAGIRDISIRLPVTALLLFVTALSAACSKPYEYPVTDMLIVTPADGTTGLSNFEIDVGVSPVPPVGPSLAAVEASTMLVTWPDGIPVPASIAGTTGPTSVGSFSVRPVAAVPDGWYAVILPTPPVTLHLTPESFHVQPDGRPVVRVRLGSAPTLWSLDICPKDGVTTEVTVTFSEIVHAATTSATPLNVSAGPPGAPVSCSSFMVPLVDRPLQAYTYECPPVAATDVVTISVADGLLSQAGVSVAVTEQLVTFGSLPADGVTWGCSSLKLDP